MGDEIDFQKSGTADIPAIGFDRDVVFEKSSRFGASVDTSFEFSLDGRQSAIDLGRTDREQKAYLGCCELETPLSPRKPKGQRGLKANRPQIAGGFPDGPENRDDGGIIKWGAAPPFGGVNGGRPIEKADGMFAVAIVRFTEFIQNVLFLGSADFFVSKIDRAHMLLDPLSTHLESPSSSLKAGFLGNILNELTNLSSVTF